MASCRRMLSSSIVQRFVSDLICPQPNVVTVNCFAVLRVVEKGDSAPKFPSDCLLGAVDLDNEMVGACKAEEFGVPFDHLFDNAEI